MHPSAEYDQSGDWQKYSLDKQSVSNYHIVYDYPPGESLVIQCDSYIDRPDDGCRSLLASADSIRPVMD
jgi:hypothetical protein